MAGLSCFSVTYKSANKGQFGLKSLQVLRFLCATLAFADQCEENTIVWDVAIVGGGSSGTFSAVRLRDEGKSVVVIEKEPILGGHTDTYRDPFTDQAVDYGVVIFVNTQVARDYFNRLNVPWSVTDRFSDANVSIAYLNPPTAERDDYTPPKPVPGFKAYAEQLSSTPNWIGAFFFLVVSSGANQIIYNRARDLLGLDVLLNSQVAFTQQRDEGGIKLTVSTSTGLQTIQANKLLLTIPPKLNNLVPFNPDARKFTLFGDLVRNTGLPQTIRSSSVSPDAPYHIAQLPGVYSVVPTKIEGLFDIKYGSPYPLPEEYVRRQILTYVEHLQAQGFANASQSECVSYRRHTPFELTVLPGNIAAGFNNKLYDLQGYRNTWYTGAAFHTHNSAALWNFTESVVLPGLLDD
ncbi:amine oxidase [Aspergillus sp. HF37]|nr:amine oxidase [Aspergillus sp. HF37]